MKKLNWFVFIILIIAALSLIFACSKKTFNVSFDSNGGSAVASIETDGRSAFKLPEPTKDGYRFEAWYYDNNTFRNVFTAGSLIASGIKTDITVYAKWTEILVSTEGLEFELREDGYAVTGYSGSAERVVVADNKGVAVTEIEEEAFINNTSIKSVIISKTVTDIGAAAFKGCSNIESITLPFVGASRQKNMSEDGVFGHIFGSTDTYDIFEGTTQQFFGSDYSRYYYIPRKLTEIKITDAAIIPYGAFYGCKYVKNIELNDGIIRIYSIAFENCSALKGVYLSSDIETVGSAAFGGSAALKIYCAAESKPEDWVNSWNKDNAPTHWGVQKNAFGQNAEYQYIIENNTISITGYISDSLENIMPSTLENKPVTKIKSYAFSGSNISKITVADSVTHIEVSAFLDANLINTLNLPFLGETASSAEKSFIGFLFGSLDSSTNKAMTPSSLRKVTLRGGALAENAFSGCDRLTEISLPRQLAAIGESVFQGCEKLTKINAPNEVTTISKNAFAGCKDLEDFDMPDSLAAIGENAFQGCQSLTSIDIPSGVKKLPENAFKGCSKLSQVVLSDALTEIGANAFEGCASIEELLLPAELKTIGVAAFKDCSALETISISKKVYLIDTNAFENCAAMTTIYIPKSVITIGEHTFRGCSSLTIYAEAAMRPSGWRDQWNIDGREVFWNFDIP